MHVPDRSSWLHASAALEPLEFEGLLRPRRRVWASAEFVLVFEAMRGWPMDRDGYESPRKQTEAMLREYSEGQRRMVDGYDFKRLRRPPEAVYEFRPRDVRIFGAMVSKGEFCAVAAMPKSELRNAQSYQPFIEKTVEFIRALAILPPRFHASRFDDVMDH